MDFVLLFTGLLTLLTYAFLAIWRPTVAVHGLESSVDMFLQSAPWIIVSMFAAGLLAQLFQPQAIAKWLGRESGFQGILIAAMLGMCGTGSRWAMYPLAAGLLSAEASPGSVFAFVTTWQLVSLPRLPAELPFYGAQFTVVRAVLSVVLAIAGGFLIDKLTH